ncbi:hypothetical protein [Microvirga sp. 2TAF3]|uniref:hypothetical protein n=1 Tax=Microvirga sp. 2TAF3 TaxID=3233014 RepID=UPI003F9B1D65
MRSILRFTVAAIAVGWAASFSAPSHSQEMSKAKLGEWVQSYHRSPDPEAIPNALKDMSRLRLLDTPKTSQALGLAMGTTGFLSGVFEQNPRRLPAMLRDWKTFEDAERAFIVRALWYSGRPEAREFIRSVWSDRMRAQLDGDLAKTGPPASADAIMVKDPGDLDFLWGRFFATGRAAPVVKIIQAAKLGSRVPRTRDGMINAMPLLIGSAAIRSLTANAERYERVLGICKESLRQSDRETAAILKDIIAKAEQRRI